MSFSIEESMQRRLGDLCRRYAVRCLKLFGSAVREDYDPMRSDLDFAVEFEAPPKGMRPATQFFGFHEELERLLGRPVDLLEELAIENSRLRRIVEAEARTIYAS